MEAQHSNVCGLLACRLQDEDELKQEANNLGLKDALLGVCSVDEVRKPSKDVYNAGYIVNFMKREDPRGGSHWVLLWYMPTFSYYFDPVGVPWPPLDILHAARFPLYTNTKFIQHPKSCQCGLFCLKMMYHLYVQHMSVQEAGEQFSSIPEQNDSVLNDFFCQHHMCIGQPNTCR